MELINLTDELVAFDLSDGRTDFLPSGIVAKCEIRRDLFGNIDGIPVARLIDVRIVGLPSSVEGKGFIVTMEVARAVRKLYPSRNDIFVADEPVYNKNGKLDGYKRLITV